MAKKCKTLKVKRYKKYSKYFEAWGYDFKLRKRIYKKPKNPKEKFCPTR